VSAGLTGLHRPTLVPAALGADAGIIGIAALAKDITTNQHDHNKHDQDQHREHLT
jgi:predicted NBD/HSP70 family sugar kinase